MTTSETRFRGGPISRETQLELRAKVDYLGPYVGLPEARSEHQSAPWAASRLINFSHCNDLSNDPSRFRLSKSLPSRERDDD